jgi:2-dehydro-3-deoxyphosphogluconate aldolase/(4S)-4-hydroxy-2-oxoglutarate aldolase
VSATQQLREIREILAQSPVMPVMVLDSVEEAVPLARALVAGGIRVLEITLRTKAALACVTAIRDAVPDALVGVGTVTSAGDLAAARAAGAQFGVSPGTTPALLAAIRAGGLPFLPGAMTPSEVMTCREAGFTALKLFPASQAGGKGMLKALGGPFPELIFCPTGGVDPTSAAELLALPNVACVGGSWLAPEALVRQRDWAAIEALARAAAALRKR